MATGSNFLVVFVLGIGCACVLYSYRDSLGINLYSTIDEEKEVVSAWEKIIKKPSKHISSVVVGVNANVDLIVSATELLRELKIQPDKTANHGTISTLEELQEVFHYFFKSGGGAERFVKSEELYNQIVDAAKKLKDKQYYVGGNAALMGLKLAKSVPDKNKIQLNGPVGPKLSSLLKAQLSVPESALQETDEYHLIMEYKKGKKWGETVAPIASRFIISHDKANSKMEALEDFVDNVIREGPDLVVLSGLHLLEGQPEPYWQDRLIEVAQKLSTLPDNKPVHLELASLANENFVRSLIYYIFPRVDSIGLNEQELGFAARSAGEQQSRDDDHDHEVPCVGEVADSIHWILTSFGKGGSTPIGQNSRLTRVHFHTLSFHLIGVIDDNTWGNTPAAVAASSQIAGLQACDLQEFNTSKVHLQLERSFKRSINDNSLNKNLVYFNARDPVTSWKVETVSLSLSPVLVCKQPVKTVGLGDAISATGLLFSEFKMNK